MFDSAVFYKPVEISRLGSELRRKISASAEERAAIAEFLDLISLEELRAEIAVRRKAQGMIEVSGQIDARVVQACVVTLEPVPASVSESFRVYFGEAEQPAALGEIDVDFEESDPPDPIVDGTIDLGQVVLEHLSLALDPYPRKPGVAVPGELAPGDNEPASGAGNATRKPFSGLDKLLK